jgi:hypothetical protein
MANKKISLRYQSAAIVAGHARPRIELPALCLERPSLERPSLEQPRVAANAVNGIVSVQVVAGNEEALREPFLGLVDKERVALVLPQAEFARLRERVRSIKQQALEIELVLNEHDQIVSAVLDGQPVAPYRAQSSVVSTLDLEIDDASESGLAAPTLKAQL